MIGNIVNGVPFWGVTLNPKIKVSKPQDLNGYSVATFPAPSTAYTLQRQMFIDGGLKPNIRETAFGTLLTALKAKQVDIALELEPNVSQSVLGGAKIAYSLASLYGDFALTGLTATPESLKEKPELAQKVVCGIQMSLDLARKEPKSALAILQKRFPEVDPKVAEEALKRLVNEKIIPANAITQQTAWDKAIKLRFQAGDIKNPKPFGEYVDNTFAEKAEKDCRYSTPSSP
ncbi:ABC transporter substrate-binding protein [Microcystis aeruginosa CS-338/01]|uniref:ABC transporter substrate-binding protein n=1 Tax=Microcystis aeruginosa TaxID=1126 RepID=UPI00232B6D42|nr:ABC transporter substrate-binding protein [Microcystis aeruginosa]MDB9506404.1 ABC transporter substrate-binding protein [Microcystis aeruginosa CS-338/01]